MKRHIFRSFPYTRSDDFAAWLSEMAAKGWVFEGFGAGLIFEKGEPQEITYAVNTFLPGSEMDTRPEPQAERSSGSSDSLRPPGMTETDKSSCVTVYS